ncbi:Maestro Heat-Like Repeat-Containing Protein Family Member 7 [Manis pentadactyla]|nr:Maestro Heat-Like Repeat-Containing Protein Family Member 7 [Manis pentadactyla]
MDPDPRKQKPHRVTFVLSADHDPRSPNLTGLRQSEREAYKFVQEFLEQEQVSDSNKLKFLRAVETLSGAVRAQANGSMNDYFPKITLAKKIETIILEESTEVLTSYVRQQAMLCVVALSQVNPPFCSSQKLDLVNAGVSSTFSLPLIMPSLDRKESASLYIQTVQALDDMLQALIMDGMYPDMPLLQSVLEVILPWLTVSEKAHEQSRAAGTISRMLRFICNFPELSRMEEFSTSGTLMGTLGLFCMNSSCETSAGASEALHYLFKVLALHRSEKPKTEAVLKGLQKHFRGEWLASIQDLAMFFQKYLTPEERADLMMVSVEAMSRDSRHDVCAASELLRMILKCSVPEIGKVPEIIQYIYHNMSSITEPTAQETIRKVLHLLAQSHTEDVILTLFRMQDQSQRGACKPWEILASFPKGYEMIMEYLLQRLIAHPKYGEPSSRREISPLIATRAIHELLLGPSRRMEVQSFFCPLFMALLLQVSCLVRERRAEVIQEQQLGAEWVDPVSSTVEALKALMCSAGYGDHASYAQQLGGWELLTSPERHSEGVTLLARAMVSKNCWHNRPLFSVAVRFLQELDHANHRTTLVFMTELLRSPEVAVTVDEVAVRVLAQRFQCEEPATVKLLLQLVEVFAKHGDMARRLHPLQPHVLSCCSSSDRDTALEAFRVLRGLAETLTWQHNSSFLIQLTFMLGPFLEEESEQLRLTAFEVCASLLARVKRRDLVFPLRHQLLNLTVPLVLHLGDVSVSVAQICRPALCHVATILGWSKLKAVFAEKDVWTILGALLKQEANKGPRFLKQCVALFKSPQAPIRQQAVWFAGQIFQTLDVEEAKEMEEALAALRGMREDPDPMASCLAMQIFYILDAKEKVLLDTPTSCFRSRRPRRSYF